MNDNTPKTPSTSGGEPLQDTVTPPNTPAVKAPAVNTPAVKAPAVKAAARPKGPNASALVVGLVAMLIAGLIIAKETMNLHVDWSKLGPATIVGMGVVMVAIGAIGLVRRHDNV
jgi:hypothetical protein